MDIDGSYYCSRCLRAIEAEGVCPHCGHDHRQQTNEPPALGMGVLLKGRYQLGCVIGCGGFGLTYAAWDETLQTPVAIKEYFPGDYAARENEYTDAVIVPESRRREYMIGLNQFLREARVLAMLKNTPGAVGVQDYFEENDTAYIVMEYLRGVTLDDYAQEKPIDKAQVLLMMRPVIDALAELHSRGVMHRDVSPMNIMVLEDGSAKLIDFGSAGQMDRQQVITFTTDCYAPIEQYEPGAEGQGAWSDVYGVCATIYRVLTGESPQPALLRAQKDELRSMHACGVRLRSYQTRALMHGLAVRPESRTQSIPELRAELYNLATPEEIRRRKATARKVYASFAALLLLIAALMWNFEKGFPVGGGLYAAWYGNGMHITGGSMELEELVIPERILGLPVQEIESGAFAQHDNLRIVQIPGTVEVVEYNAFAYCDVLETVVMEEGVQEIDEMAFYASHALRSVYVPQSVTYISSLAFDSTSDLLTVWGVRGSEAHLIAQYAGWGFADRSEYDVVEAEGGVAITACRSTDEMLVIPPYIDGKLVVAPDNDLMLNYDKAVKTVVFPGTLGEIPAAYAGQDVECYVIRGGTKAIGADAFERQHGNTFTGLTVFLPEGLEEIREDAFFLSGVRQIALPSTLHAIGRNAFGNSDLKEIVIPSSVTDIGAGAFQYAELEHAVLPSSLTEIPQDMFLYCDALKQVEIPVGVRRIGDSAFQYCSQLECVELPDGLESIGKEAFAVCSGLRFIYIPATVTGIDETAFEECSSRLVICSDAGSVAQTYADAHGIAFEDRGVYTARYPYADYLTGICINAKEEVVVCPTYNFDKKTRIRQFSGPEQMQSVKVVLPGLLEDIAIEAFKDAANLTEVTIPDTVRRVDIRAFEGCVSLKQIAFAYGLESVSREAFKGCAALTQISLPDSVTRMEQECFAACTSLQQFRIPGGITSLNSMLFTGSGLISISVPGNVRTVNQAFYGCEELEEVVLEEGVMEMLTALQQCTSLKSVVIPSSMQRVSRGTLRGCTALEDIYIYAENVDLEYALYSGSMSELLGGGYTQLESGTDEPHLLADCPDVTIHGLPGSTAQAYAQKYGIAFEPLEP